MSRGAGHLPHQDFKLAWKSWSASRKQSQEPSSLIGSMGLLRQNSRLQYWSKRYGRDLALGDAVEIQKNLAAYFKILAEWDAEDKAIETQHAAP